MTNTRKKHSLKTKAFRRGFREGFSAPMFMFTPLFLGRTKMIDSSIGSAWNNVGAALDKSFRKEIKRGQAFQKTIEQRKESA